MFSWLISPWKDVNSLPEIKLQDNEKLYFQTTRLMHLMRVIQLGIKNLRFITAL